MTKLPLSPAQNESERRPAWPPGQAPRVDSPMPLRPHGRCLTFVQQNDCSLGSSPAREKGCLCCVSWSYWPLHKSKTMGLMLTI